jgi:hypothetical protein
MATTLAADNGNTAVGYVQLEGQGLSGYIGPLTEPTSNHHPHPLAQVGLW